MPSEYDITIVGAGPAGCSAAHFLSRDYKVLLIDANKPPRDKPCGGILVEEASEFIKKMNPPKKIFSSPKELPLAILDWDNNLSVEQKRFLTNVNRKEFDYWLLENALKKIDFFAKTKLISFSEKTDCVRLTVDKEGKSSDISTRCLIGADGANSSIRRSLSTNLPKMYPCIQQWIKPKKNIDKIYFIFFKQVSDYYSWLIPKGEFLVMGAAIEDKKNVRTNFDIFKKDVKKKLGISGPAKKEEGAIGSRPMSEKDIFLGTKRILMVGEAAGLISPSTGDGISFALRSGYNVAVALNSGLENVDRGYRELSSQLIKEMRKKISKSNLFLDAQKRPLLLEHLSK